MCVQFKDIKKGDLIKVKIPARWGWLRGWRTVTGSYEGFVLIRANGTREFLVRPNEIIEHARTYGAVITNK